jgi:endonuclease/exonuclease/phosphatase family metal-dependent hydrolase
MMLQEADADYPPHAGFLDIAAIEARCGLRSVHGSAGTRWSPQSHGFLGVLCFVGPGIEVERVAVVDLPGHCHRGAVVVDMVKGGRPVRVIGTHLSLGQVLRVAQMRTIGQYLRRQVPRPMVLCGDLNEWRPWGGLALSRGMLGARFTGPARATFPVRYPVLPLDRVLGAGGARVLETAVLDGPGIRIASDHRPLAARVAV